MQRAANDFSERYHAVISHASRALIGLDYDGTLAPLVDDPQQAVIHPAIPGLLRDLCSQVHAVAIMTGRPARQALTLGGLEDLAESCPNLVVVGQYGNETWTAMNRRVVSPLPPPGMARFLRDLPAVLRRLDIDPWIEEKGLAVALHTRRLPDPTGAYRLLLPVITELAAEHGLVVEPGRLVVEARAPGMDKGVALRQLIEETQPSALIFAGDDLGDIPAFAEVRAARDRGLPTLGICTGSPTEPRIAAEADLILKSPKEMAEFFTRLLEDTST